MNVRAPVFLRQTWIAGSHENMQVRNSLAVKDNVATLGPDARFERLTEPRDQQSNRTGLAVGEVREGWRVPLRLHHERTQLHRRCIVGVVGGADQFIFVDESPWNGNLALLNLAKQAFHDMSSSIL